MPPTVDVKDFTDEQKRLFNSAASLGSGVQTINSASLTQQPTINYQAPQEPPVYPVAGLGVDTLQPTQQEQKASTLSDELANLNTQLLGESQLRAEQETAQGIPELAKTNQDLSARLKALQNEALAIPLQLQQDVTGRGVTEGGLRPIQTAALRNNAIQSLTVASQLEASRGNMTLALDLVDRAVAQRFDPIKERIAAAEKNLKLILDDPRTSLQDKNRAQKQMEQQEARKKQIALQEAKELEKGKAVLEYASIADALTLREMQNAPDAVAVQQIAAQKGLVTPAQAKEKAQTDLILSQIEENYANVQNLKSKINERNNAPEGIPTLNGRPQNATQATANGFADRMNEADLIISGIGSQFTGKFAIGGSLPNILQTESRQSYEQAKRNFINAVLRRESGAVISPQEFDNAEKQYFPVAGDKPSTVAQKTNNRNTVINNLYREANVTRALLPGSIVEADGKRYQLDLDGETLIEL